MKDRIMRKLYVRAWNGERKILSLSINYKETFRRAIQEGKQASGADCFSCSGIRNNFSFATPRNRYYHVLRSPDNLYEKRETAQPMIDWNVKGAGSERAEQIMRGGKIE